MVGKEGELSWLSSYVCIEGTGGAVTIELIRAKSVSQMSTNRSDRPNSWFSRTFSPNTIGPEKRIASLVNPVVITTFGPWGPLDFYGSIQSVSEMAFG